MTNQEMKNELTMAYGYGVNAFMKGQPRKPYLDSLVMALVNGKISKHSARRMKAWLDGWDSCNATMIFVAAN